MKIKKIAAAVIAAAVLVTTVSLPGILPNITNVVNAAETVIEGDYEYQVNEDGETVTVTKYNGEDAVVNIPNALGGKTVTGIGSDAFAESNSVINVTISNSVRSIGTGAFSHCDSLEEIIVGEGNAYFSSLEGVLYNKEKTELICFPAGCGEFNGNFISIPGTIKRIGEYAFWSGKFVIFLQYDGTRADWLKIKIGENNDFLRSHSVIIRTSDDYIYADGSNISGAPRPEPEPEPDPAPTSESEPLPESPELPEPAITTDPVLIVTTDSEPTPITTTNPEPVVTTEPTPIITTNPELVVTTEPTPITTTNPELVVTTEPTPIITTDPEPVVTTEPAPVVTTTTTYITDPEITTTPALVVTTKTTPAPEITTLPDLETPDDHDVTADVEMPEGNNVPEGDQVKTIVINAFNMKGKGEIDLSDVKIKAQAIYDEEGLKRAEEALGTVLDGNTHYNLLDLTLLYKGEDFSNGYEGLIQVRFKIPDGHKNKTFSCYRLTEVDGKMVKELIPGTQKDGYYIIYLEHFSLYALVGDGNNNGDNSGNNNNNGNNSSNNNSQAVSPNPSTGVASTAVLGTAVVISAVVTIIFKKKK